MYVSCLPRGTVYSGDVNFLVGKIVLVVEPEDFGLNPDFAIY